MWLWHTRQLGLLIGLLPGKYHHHLSTDSSMTWTFRILFLPSPSGQSLQWSQLSLFTTLNRIHPTQTGSHDFSELMLFLATMLATGAFLSFTFYLSSCPAPYALLPSPSNSLSAFLVNTQDFPPMLVPQWMGFSPLSLCQPGVLRGDGYVGSHDMVGCMLWHQVVWGAKGLLAQGCSKSTFNPKERRKWPSCGLAAPLGLQLWTTWALDPNTMD